MRRASPLVVLAVLLFAACGGGPDVGNTPPETATVAPDGPATDATAAPSALREITNEDLLGLI